MSDRCDATDGDDLTEMQYRSLALGLAIEWEKTRDRASLAADVVDCAEKFLAFLKGGKSDAAD